MARKRAQANVLYSCAVTLPPEFDEPAFESIQRLDRVLDRGQSRLFRVLWFWLPPTSVARAPRFQQLLASRFLTDVALQLLLYGVLIAVARRGGGASDAALIGVAYLLPGAVLGLFGGLVADAVSRKVALAGAYLGMGLITLLLPSVLGTGLPVLLGVLFTVRLLYQVAQPSEASAVPLVASEPELASATSFLGLASSAGEMLGKALLAPTIVRFYGVQPATLLAALLLLLSASRVFDLDASVPRSSAPGVPAGSVLRRTAEVLRLLGTRQALLWMLLLGSLGSTASQVLGILGPEYTREVLEVDPANALYVFAPAAVGLVGALGATPLLIRVLGEHLVARLGFVLIAATLTGIGFAPELSRIAWLPLVDLPGVSRAVEVASALSLGLGFAITLATAAAQTYVARRVPLGLQGRTFALLSMAKDAIAVVALLGLGAVSQLLGVRTIITLAPWLMLALAAGIDHAARRWRAGQAPPGLLGR